MESLQAIPNNWKLSEKILFRFFFIFYATNPIGWFFSLFPWLPRQITWDGILWSGYQDLRYKLVNLVGKYLLDLKVGTARDLDTIYDYVLFFTYLLIAFIGCVIWSVLDRKRKSYRKLFYWLVVYVRYSLAVVMLNYGISKLFFLQFNPRQLDLEKLITPYGNFAPPQLLANFMAYSKSYQFFTGITEVIGGILILFRRTTLMGAIILFGVLSNVFMLNFNFGFGVTEYSLELLIMATFLLAIDRRRIVRVFLLNKSVDPFELRPSFTKRWMKFAKLILKLYFIAYLCLYLNFLNNWHYYLKYVRGPDPPLYGLYKVESFVRNNDTLPPFPSDKIRWDRLVVSFPGWVNVHLMNDSSIRYDYKPDTVNRRFIISSYSDTLDKYMFSYSEPDSSTLILDGTWKQDSIVMLLKKEDVSELRLRRWKTGWVTQPKQ